MLRKAHLTLRRLLVQTGLLVQGYRRTSPSYEHWHESDHDDLVLATALACWWLRRRKSVLRLVGARAI
jgi:hypothetical protein